MRIAYKVVHKVQDKLFSINSCNGFIKKYHINRWVYPVKDTKLFVFDTVYNALLFINKQLFSNEDTYQIYKCYIYNYRRCKYISTICPGDIIKFWSDKSKKINVINKSYSRQAPIGTLYCDKIKLIQRIPYDCTGK